jgi:aldoxime dehydratase
MSQTHDMEPVGAPRVVVNGLNQRVIPHENICLIRSGQDWSATQAEERRMYLEDVEPVLRAGMNFLRDDGLQIGCFVNRHMTVVDGSYRPAEKTFGMSWWKSLAALERWAESHPTHLAIFGAAMKYLGTMGPAAKLKLYHEVTVAAADEQYFEYYNCHPKTGMLRTAASVG